MFQSPRVVRQRHYPRGRSNGERPPYCLGASATDSSRIEERTVKAHVAKLMRKVGVQNRIALSVHAITHSLVSSAKK